MMDAKQLSAIFNALADPTRRAIIERLTSGQATAGELAEPFGITKPAISKHLKVLESANLIQRKKRAQWHQFQLQSGSLKLASDWILKHEKFWSERLDELSEFLNHKQKGDLS